MKVSKENLSEITTEFAPIEVQRALYLTTKQLANLFNVSERKARQIVAERNLKPVDLGRGRGNGLRWRTSAVIDIADILHAEAQAQENRTLRQNRPVHLVRGKSAKELWAEFNGKKRPSAEVCHGN